MMLAEFHHVKLPQQSRGQDRERVLKRGLKSVMVTEL